ncbi:hypothetical protein COU59_00145 [Candidatus Pacearchaeota archaeon CG10_big_fil_rev_8_21_14_0_10_34_12]|nr:MAG: hypothetical protein COU59_00145 [Candidatus Pacearchaeota archaeon CG10_big_fil_rev_8_21_14_0_10_34_12]
MRNKKDKLQFSDVITRYVVLVAVAIPNLWLFYFVFTPLTIYPIYYVLGQFFPVSLLSSKILLINHQLPIEFIEACIAGAAYYFLLILNLSTPQIKLSDRIKMIFLSFFLLLTVNVIRITTLILMIYHDVAFFNVTHLLFWYLLSTVFVIAIWFFEVKLFKIKNIPFYSDLKFLHKKSILR